MSIDFGAYRLVPKSTPNLILELAGGSSGNNTQAQGWVPMNLDTSFYNQIWLVRQDDANFSFSFQNLRGGSEYHVIDTSETLFESILAKTSIAYLNLNDIRGGNGSAVTGWERVPNNNQRWNVAWVQRVVGIDYYKYMLTRQQ
jgi:hypothetical protein